MSLQSATLFRDALRGLRFLHAHGWVHCDIKPQNIGVLTHPLRAVLLDLGQITKLALGAKLGATPGCAGTINYIPPEREMDEYDHGIDVWPMGVIGYELTYGVHPFKFAANPWRRGHQYERLRPSWQDKYEKAIAMITADYKQWLAQQRAGRAQKYFHCEWGREKKRKVKKTTDRIVVGDLLAQVMRQPWAKHNSARRISIDEALENRVWEHFSVAGPQSKRGKPGEADTDL
jgi:serine/threonine protein kinase